MNLRKDKHIILLLKGVLYYDSRSIFPMRTIIHNNCSNYVQL